MARNTQPKKGRKSDDELDPTGEHGKNAVEEVARKMHIDEGSSAALWDPTGDHDPEAMKDVARKMGIKQ